MTEEERRIPIGDKRAASQSGPGTPPGFETSPTEPGASAFDLGADGPHDDASIPAAVEEGDAKQDFLDDLLRLQADFDNYRKRMMREQTASAARATTRLIERLLPVLDDFERALEHDEGGSAALLYKSLRSVLEAQGLEEITAEGVPFDPHVHEAVDSREDPEAREIVCRSVFRRGYRVRDQVLRPAMVVVARPPEAPQVGGDPSTEVAEG